MAKLATLCKISKITNSRETVSKQVDHFVFFDLETTDFIKRKAMPKITELSMIAVSRGALKCDRSDLMAVPRILQKLTMTICPNEPINPQASSTSKLWNKELECFQPFNETTYNIIMQFLSRLSGNVCFVAHNGHKFDYPVLLSEIMRIDKTLPDSILCVDSLKAFQEFYSDIPVTPAPLQVSAGYAEVDEELERCKMKKYNNSFEDNWDEALYSVMDTYDQNTAVESASRSRHSTFENGFGGMDVLDAITNKVINSSCIRNTPNQKTLQEMNETTPENQSIRKFCLKSLSRARKMLMLNESKPKNLKLSTIHLHMVGKEAENQHSAEADCVSMLRCVCQLGAFFAEWADRNAIIMNTLKKK